MPFIAPVSDFSPVSSVLFPTTWLSSPLKFVIFIVAPSSWGLHLILETKKKNLPNPHEHTVGESY
jgi:hypothetical protein